MAVRNTRDRVVERQRRLYEPDMDFRNFAVANLASAQTAPQPRQTRQPSGPSLSDVASNIVKEKAKDKAIDYALEAGDDVLGIGSQTATGLAEVSSNYMTPSLSDISTDIAADIPSKFGTMTDPAISQLSEEVGKEVGKEAGYGLVDAAGDAAAIYGLYDLGKDWGRGNRSIAGAGMSTAKGALAGYQLGGPIGGVVGGVYGLASSIVKSGKHEDQNKRDAVRSRMQEIGFYDPEFNVTLADGTAFDMSRDGGAEYTGVGGKKIRYGYETDPDNPLTVSTSHKLIPLGLITTGGNKDLFANTSYQLTNAAISNAATQADADENVLAFYNQLGIKEEQAYGAIDKAFQDELITEEEARAYQNALNEMYGKIEEPKEETQQEQEPKRKKRKGKKKEEVRPPVSLADILPELSQVPDYQTPNVPSGAEYERLLEESTA